MAPSSSSSFSRGTRTASGMLAWKPMVTLTRSAISVSFRRLHDLGEHAARRPGVHEGHARSPDARPRRLVDEPKPRGPQALELGLDVGRLVGDVVKPRPVLGQELADGRVRAQRRQQLDVALADVEQDGLDALGLHRLAVDEVEVEVGVVERERRVEVLDGDADVVDAREHAAAECKRSELGPPGYRPKRHGYGASPDPIPTEVPAWPQSTPA